MYKLSLILVPLSIILFTTKPQTAMSQSFEIDVTCGVYNVVDENTFDCFPVGRIRLADINAPELSEPEGYEG